MIGNRRSVLGLLECGWFHCMHCRHLVRVVHHICSWVWIQCWHLGLWRIAAGGDSWDYSVFLADGFIVLFLCVSVGVFLVSDIIGYC